MYVDKCHLYQQNLGATSVFDKTAIMDDNILYTIILNS